MENQKHNKYINHRIPMKKDVFKLILNHKSTKDFTTK